jgi:hypothetical protein
MQNSGMVYQFRIRISKLGLGSYGKAVAVLQYRLVPDGTADRIPQPRNINNTPFYQYRDVDANNPELVAAAVNYLHTHNPPSNELE